MTPISGSTERPAEVEAKPLTARITIRRWIEAREAVSGGGMGGSAVAGVGADELWGCASSGRGTQKLFRGHRKPFLQSAPPVDVSRSASPLLGTRRATSSNRLPGRSGEEPQFPRP